MIGPYSQFKGKLKAGDRVRVEYGGRTSLGEVNETSESGFTVRENMDEWRCVERFIFWTSEGTLELLSPSPRVVTDTEAPSLPLIAKFTVKARGSVDYNNIIKMTNPTDKDVYAMVWDASPPATAEAAFSNVRCYDGPMSREQFEKILKDSIERKPAPAEKEAVAWWYDIPYQYVDMNGHEQPLIDKIVAEAKCRGAEEERNKQVTPKNKQTSSESTYDRVYRQLVETEGAGVIGCNGANPNDVRDADRAYRDWRSRGGPAGAGEK